jgi:hypothetical protein
VTEGESNLSVPTAGTKPSELLEIAAEQLTAALADIRQQTRHARGEEKEKLRRLRDAIHRRLDALAYSQLDAIDQDPETMAAAEAIAELVGRAERAAGEMQTASNAILRATKIVGYADQILRLIGKSLF